MAKYTNPGAGDIAAIKSDGTIVPVVDGVGCTLLANSTYFFPFGDSDAPVPTETPVVSVHAKWDNAIAITSATIETCNFPRHLRNVRTDTTLDVTDQSTTPGHWIPQNPPGAYLPIGGAGTATVFVASCTVGQEGGADWELSGLGAKRGHLKVVVGAAGGVVRVNASGKAGG